jgi:hypothetical protein
MLNRRKRALSILSGIVGFTSFNTALWAMMTYSVPVAIVGLTGMLIAIAIHPSN